MASKGNDKLSSPVKRKKKAPLLLQGKKKRAELSLNPLYTKAAFKSAFSSGLKNKTDVSQSNAKVISKPFPHCVLPNFLVPPSFVDRLETTVYSLPYVQKDIDLYRLSQTLDLSSITNSEIGAFKRFLCGTFRSWLCDVTGINLDISIDLSASCYRYGDYLLCHNDQCDRRRVAFIYYLVSEWKEDDGGNLVFFDSANDEPSEPVNFVTPQNNCFVFFEVSPHSYHQVSEVIKVKNRYAIGGWFHADPAITIEPQQPILEIYLPGICQKNLADYIDAAYLGKFCIGKICENFKEESEIHLCNFLKREVYNEVCHEMNGSTSWSLVGPPHKRCFLELCGDILPATAQLLKFLQSNLFSQYLSVITGLTLHNHESPSPNSGHPSADNGQHETASTSTDESSGKLAHFSFKICRFEYGSYTLLHDPTDKVLDKSLDAILFLNCQDWDRSYGGCVSYTDEDSKDSLVDVLPIENSLSLVFCEPGVMKFTKYINHSVLQRELPYYNIFNFKFFEGKEQ